MQSIPALLRVEKGRKHPVLLTKKGFRKVVLMAAAYLAVGSLSLLLSAVFAYRGIPSVPLVIMGMAVYLLCIPLIFWGRYAEGVGKPVRLGLTLVRRQLQPAAFLRQYEDLLNTPDLIIKKPGVEVLQLVMLAYELLGDSESALAVAEDMIRTTAGNKRRLACLFKVSLLYAYGRIGEAEALLGGMRAQKLNMICRSLAETITKGDRALALGDTKTAESFYLGQLKWPFPKPDAVSLLVSHYYLGEIYTRQNEPEKAAEHYRYCAEYGGATALQTSAAEKLQRMPG